MIEDEIILEELSQEEQEKIEHEKMLEKARRKAQETLAKKKAQEEALAEVEAQEAFEKRKEEVNENKRAHIDEHIYEGLNSKVGRRSVPVSDAQIQKKTFEVVKAIKSTVDNEVIRALFNPHIDQDTIEELRTSKTESELGPLFFDVMERVREDLEKEIEPGEWATNDNVLAMLDYIVYVFGQSNVVEAVYAKRAKNGIKNLLLTDEIIASYRHTFKDEGYETLLRSIPKYFVDKYGEDYLRESFIILHILFKYGKDIMRLSVKDIIDIIISKNDILPATVKYNRPYTEEYWLELSKFKIFTAMQNICIEEMTIEQAMSLSSMIDTKISVGKETGSIKANELKALSDTLSKLQTIIAANKVKEDPNQDSIVIRVPAKGLDYTNFIYIEEHDVGQRKDREYIYYIACFKKERNNPVRILKGYVQDLEGTFGFNQIKIFENPKEIVSVLRKIQDDPSLQIDTEVMKIDKKEYNLMFSAQEEGEEKNEKE